MPTVVLQLNHCSKSFDVTYLLIHKQVDSITETVRSRQSYNGRQSAEVVEIRLEIVEVYRVAKKVSHKLLSKYLPNIDRFSSKKISLAHSAENL